MTYAETKKEAPPSAKRDTGGGPEAFWPWLKATREKIRYQESQAEDTPFLFVHPEEIDRRWFSEIYTWAYIQRLRAVGERDQREMDQRGLSGSIKISEGQSAKEVPTW